MYTVDNTESLVEDFGLVSIVMPLFNCEQFVGEAIQSTLDQTYTNWELLIIDDCSTDRSRSVVREFMGDRRIKLFCLEKNCGAAETRDFGIKRANGRWIAFFDSDDVWLPNKLEVQLREMSSNNLGMCFTSYETIEADGTVRNVVHVPSKINYKGFLKNTVTCSHTVVFDTQMIDVNYLFKTSFEEKFDYPDDLAIWLNVLKQGFIAYGIDEVLAKNRKRTHSRSANKLRAVRRTWNQYRKVEQLSMPYAVYCLFWQLFHAVKKRL